MAASTEIKVSSAQNDNVIMDTEIEKNQFLDENTNNELDEKSRSLRIRIDNLPNFFSTLQVRKFLNKTFPGVKYNRLKTMHQVAIFSFNSEAEIENALKILNGMQIKKFTITAKRVAEESMTARKPTIKNAESTTISECTNASELVTPLANLPYDQQLEKKHAESKTIVNNLMRQISHTGIRAASGWRNRLKEVIPSPVVTGYRNKCEFSIASDDKTGVTCVGFVQGRMAAKELSIMKVDECINLTKNTISIVLHFEDFIRNFDSRLLAFNEFERVGFWKMLTVRDFLGDCMMIVTVHPHPDVELVERAKQALVKKFIHFGNVREPIDFRVTSLYWQTLDNAGDPKVYEHLFGTPYVYETLLGVKFRISASSFFQTNSRGAEILYTQIGDAFNLPRVNSTVDSVNDAGECVDDLNGNDDINNNGDDNEPFQNGTDKNAVNSTVDDTETISPKKIRTSPPSHPIAPGNNGSANEILSLPSTVILDICCGAGTIGICLMKRMQSLVMQKKLHTAFGCVGIELIPEAIRDAKINAINNGFTEKNCHYIAGQAELIFQNLYYHMPEGCTWENVNIFGVLDPPRAGVSDKVIIGCRKLEQLKRLVYVSCDPKAAIKNLTDLCRPTSNKYEGEPFEIISIQPVDMFPHTDHFEWVVSLRKASAGC